MSSLQKTSLLLLRLCLGWVFLYAGISHLLDNNFAAATGGYLAKATTFAPLFHWFGSPALLPWTSGMVSWGLTIAGISLILGIFLRWGAVLGIIFMLLFYFPILDFPYPNKFSFLVDEHIVYVFALLVLYAFDAGKAWGLDKFRK